jgi:hypothetical protein
MQNEVGENMNREGPDMNSMDAIGKPDAKLAELSELLVGIWRVEGPDITGVAEYRTRKDGSLLVADVDFTVGDSKMKVMQHISHDQDRDTLRARYMDTMGDAATYTWVLEGGKIRVSLGDEGSDTYFEATLNEDYSQYSGTWHYGELDAPDASGIIVYTRMLPDASSAAHGDGRTKPPIRASDS